MSENKHLRFFVLILYAILAFFTLFIVFKYLIWWFLPFLIGMGIAVLIERPVSLTQKHLRLPRAPCSLIWTFAACFGLGCAVWFICTKILGEIYELLLTLPDSSELLMGLARWVQRLPDGVRAYLIGLFETGLSLPQSWIEGLGRLAARAAASLPSILFAGLVSIIAAYFFSADRETLIVYLRESLPPKWKKICSATRREGLHMASCYLRAAALMLTLTFAILAVGLAFLRIPYAVGIAFLVALVDAVPILGTGTVLLPWALMRLLSGDTATAIGLVILYGIALTVRNLVEPKVLGAQIGLHPILTLMTLYVGIHAFGAAGILLPIPITILLNVYQQQKAPH